MEAILRQAQQPGYACIIVTNCPTLPPEIRCSIQRSSDGQYLSKEGLWGNTIESLVPENPYWDNEKLTFFLPLHIVSDIDSLDGYALYINDLDRCILDIPEELNVLDASPTGCVTGVPDPEPVNTAGFMPSQPNFQPGVQPGFQPGTAVTPEPAVAPEPATAPEQTVAPEPAMDPQPQSVPQPEQVQAPDAAAMPPEAGEEAKPAAGGLEEEVSSLSLAGQSEDQAKKKKNMVPIIAAIAVILLLAAGAGLYFSGVFDSKETPAPAEEPADKGKAEEKADAAKEKPAEQAEPAKTTPAQPAEAPKDAQPAAPKPAAPEAANRPISQARTLLQGGAASADLLNTAKPMRSAQASDESSDAAFLLIEQAAQNGDNAEAMYLLAQFYDPNATLPRGTIQPDLAQAHDWYKKARDKGFGDADASLAKLKEACELKANTGDREAKALLQRW